MIFSLEPTTFPIILITSTIFPAKSDDDIKIGEIEVDFEGPEEFLKADLPELMSAIAGLHQPAPSGGKQSTAASEAVGKTSINPASLGTVASIAARLRVSSGPDLVIATAAYLTFVRNVDALPRNTIRDEMKNASGYYKATYNSNLSGYLNNLVKTGRLLEQTTNVYALSVSERSRLEGLFANTDAT